MSLLTLPLDFAAGMTDVVRTLTEFPGTLERTLRETNCLIAGLGEQLQRLQTQIDRIGEQIETVGPSVDRLLAQLAPLIDVADGARQQLTAATAQLTTTAHDLERIANFAEPLDAVGKRVVDQFRRVTGRRDPSGP